ncbi:Rpn family recombination-promoting nuclease/putative transposase [Spirulina sp. CCNP1310]|uniref:Rpn family recombination-promoting nuclease/putative transposase n=1 Tax=Spirulina sp. CCNP1310 TaxID=3110249 RepID=UPI002B1F78E5|nr:Rpn family recombination-promoting nuclease/putative transposase [Spirulina sp. CCNP1310]MEA5419058.1 Rpn family recombination-promoting nuclease/putative transposase [Spirulina sp. CCNP1310]
MANLPVKYLNPFTDYGFKKLFGEEPNKNLLLDFLNELLKDEQGPIVSLHYIKNEQLGSSDLDRRAIFDLYCENEAGERFIVELQKSKQRFFKDRTVYYSTFPIRDQAPKNDWDYQLSAVYLIAILDFVFDEDQAEPEKYRYDVKLTDIDTCKVFYDKLTFIYLEMPKFTKTIEQLETRFDKWLYVLRNLTEIQAIPPSLQEQVFQQLFETAEIAKFSREQMRSYEDSLKYYRDLKNSMDTARDEGKVEGIEIGREEGIGIGREEGIGIGREEGVRTVALALLREGMSEGVILKTTGLTAAELAQLRRELG